MQRVNLSYTVFNCSVVGVPNPHVIQGSAVCTSQTDSNTYSMSSNVSAVVAQLHGSIGAHSWDALLFCQIREGLL